MKKLIFLVVLTTTALTASAQLPPPCAPGQPPADACSGACIYCNFNGYSGSTNNYGPDGANGFCGSIENDQWLGFIAGASSATFTATPTGCTTGDGVQIALYDACDGNPIACNGGQDGGGNIPVSIDNVPLTPGSNYFLLIDGFGGDQCSFTITVDPPIAVIAPPLGNSIGPISGPSQVCPGAVVNYSIPDVPNAGAYTWTVPNGWLINGQSSPQQILSNDGGTSVDITIGNTSGTICVQAANSCYPNGPSICKTITVAPIPPTVLPKAIVCNEDAPYTLPWGDQAPSSGMYQVTLDSYLGCDSVVKQEVVIKPALITTLPAKTLCAGGFITVCGQDYYDAGNYTTVCESFQGCDSVINFSIQILDPVAIIQGGGQLTCNTNSILLTAATSPPGTILTWKNAAGVVLGTGSSYNVTAAGTYILNATMNGNGVSCSKADTVVITQNNTPPTLAATGGALSCSITSVQLNATSNAGNPTWSWTGPGGFNSNIANPLASNPGTYTVSVTDGVTGCVANTTALVTVDTLHPQLQVFGATLSCSISSTQITVISNPPNGTYNWAGPNGFTSSLQTPTVIDAGTYTVTVTNAGNGCSSIGLAVVNLDNTPPGATAATGGTISCNTPDISLNGGPGNAGNTFAWTGPNGFSSTSQNPMVNLAGTYNLTVTGSNGCTSTASTTATGDTIAPDASAVGGNISCGIPNTTITGQSNTSGATFQWTGPGMFNSGQQNPDVSAAGIYTLTVTGPNFCTASATATVTGDFTPPDLSATGGTITCTQNSDTISSFSNTNGVTYHWTGPGGFTSNLASVVVNTVGTYTVTATAPNGCTSSATAIMAPDSNIPTAAATGDTLTCTTTSIVIDGTAFAQGGASIMWTGPNNFTSTDEDPTATVDGLYTLTVTDMVNGCTAQATATVLLDNQPPGATAQGGLLNCSIQNLNLAGGTNSSSVTWNWAGPNGFNSSLQNPNTNTPGDYTLTVTDQSNGCVSTATTTVTADLTPPQGGSNTGTLTCAEDSLTLNANSNVSSSFNWSGPGGYSAMGPNAVVSIPGDYLLIVTATSNGCTDSVMVTVSQDIQAPDGTTTGNTITCSNPQVAIGVTSMAGVSFEWSGPGNFSSNIQNPTVDSAGTYTVVITGANGCTTTAQADVLLDTQAPGIQSVPSDTLTCSVTSITLQTDISSTSTVISTTWTGPNSYSSSVEDPDVTDGGQYQITVTTQNGCTAAFAVDVNQDTLPPDALAQGGTLTCTDTLITLDGSSLSNGATFSWSGPGGFNSNNEDPGVNADGTYTLTVTGTNGCISTAQAIVNQDIAPPGASAVSSNNLDCDDLNAILTASSPTSGVDFVWSGPNNFSADTAITQTAQPGDYQVIATGGNGCTSIATVTITQDIQAPDATAQGGVVDCISGQINLSGNSSVNGVAFAWAGPNNYTSNQQNPLATNPGQYILTVTGPNGCTATATADVIENTDAPQVALVGADTLTCAVTAIDLSSTIQTPGATGVWTGPNNFSSSDSVISVLIPGTYVFTVTAQNGCISAPSLTVPQDTAAPQNVTATGGLLNCSFPSIALGGNSSGQDVQYSWTGPGNFSSDQQNPAVSTPGNYVLMVTDISNGCTTSASADVTQDPTVPDIAVTADSLTCSTTSVVLNATTNTPGVQFLWSGPNNFSSTLEDPQTTAPGTYTVVATAQSGCTASFNFTVTQNIVNPGVTAVGDTITCNEQSGIVSASSNTGGVSYAWSGPGNFNSTNPAPVVTITGDYTVIATGINGCTSSATVVVAPDINAPVVTATGNTITCFMPTVGISATANQNVIWQWSGPGGFTADTANPQVTAPGNYTVSATAPNGCVTTQVAVVQDNTEAPAISTETPDELDCTTTQTGLSATATGSGPFAFLWSTANGNILSGANTASPQVNQGGNYDLVVTNQSNGCTSSTTVVVQVDPATPSGVAMQPHDVSCYGDTNGSLVIDSVQGGTPPILYSVDNQPYSSSTQFSALAPGTHALSIQDANGCEFATTFVIAEPDELTVSLGPDTTIHLGQSIVLDLDHTVSDTSRVKTIRVLPAGMNFLDTLTPVYSIKYQVEITDQNGCKASDTRFIIVDRTRWVYIPNAFNPASNENNLVMIYGGVDVELVKSFRIFDRWGNALFEQRNFTPNDPANGWDGRFKGEEMNPGVFVYEAEILFKDGETVVYKGDVTLIR